ncbi:ABC transporter permease [Halobaculum sp. MBLA0143]|uniref:ABC transporter permease n=1 Tax=Halobaculum sp. MBLA0143 TaxID=3079933 RepID=UPI00352426B8
MSLADQVRPAGLARALGGRSSSLLVVPLLLFDLLVFVVPFGYLLRISLTERTTATAYGEGTWSLDGFQYVLETATLRETYLFTLGFAAVATVVSVGIAVLYAYAMWRAEGVRRLVLTAGVLVSMFTAIVVKLFAAILVFAPNGVLAGVLTATGLFAKPPLLVNNVIGALLGQLYVVVPYSVLAVYSVLATVDESLLEAARDLGAGRLRTFRAVVLPHTVPGMLVAGVISFTWSVGAYAAPLLVGSSSERTAGMAVSDLLLNRFDWSAAAALAVLVTLTVFLVLVVTRVVLTRLEVDAGV